MAAQQQYHYKKGLGFVFTAEGGVVGVDIDHCLEQGALGQVASEIVRRYPTYTEVSPSGTGLHLFYRGTMAAKGNKNSDTGVEMYAHSRFFTMTGNRLENTPTEIADGLEALPWIHETYVAKQKPTRKAKSSKALRSYPLSDEQVLEKARSAQTRRASPASGMDSGRAPMPANPRLTLPCAARWRSGRAKILLRWIGCFGSRSCSVRNGIPSTIPMVRPTARKLFGRRWSVPRIPTPRRGVNRRFWVRNGRYYRVKGEAVYPITNFIVQPLEMIESADEAQMTCILITQHGEEHRQIFLSADFSNVQRFKGVLNKRTIELCYTGGDGDLELFKEVPGGSTMGQENGRRPLRVSPARKTMGLCGGQHSAGSSGRGAGLDRAAGEVYRVGNRVTQRRNDQHNNTDGNWNRSTSLQRLRQDCSGACMVRRLLPQGASQAKAHQVPPSVSDWRSRKRQVQYAGTCDPASLCPH